MEGWMWIPIVIGLFFLWGWISDLIDAHEAKEKERVYEEWPQREGTLALLEKYRKKLDSFYKKITPKGDVSEDRLSGTIIQGVELEDSKACPKCHAGFLRSRKGRYGRFFGCSNYPSCNYTKNESKIVSSVKKRFNKNAKEAFTEDFLKLLRQYDV